MYLGFIVKLFFINEQLVKSSYKLKIWRVHKKAHGKNWTLNLLQIYCFGRVVARISLYIVFSLIHSSGVVCMIFLLLNIFSLLLTMDRNESSFKFLYIMHLQHKIHCAKLPLHLHVVGLKFAIYYKYPEIYIVTVCVFPTRCQRNISIFMVVLEPVCYYQTVGIPIVCWYFLYAFGCRLVISHI